MIIYIFFFYFFFQEEDLFLYNSTKIFTEKREKTDISNTVRNIVEKQKQKDRQPSLIKYMNTQT